jgi:hypothetical protein
MTAHRRPADLRRRWLAAGLAASLVAIGLLATVAVPAGAEEPVLVIDWSRTAPASGRVLDGTVEVTADSRGGTFPLASVQPPDVGRVGYAIRGQIRYSNVVGQGYLEMWSVFADGQRFFSRTLAASGSGAALTGSSDWRPFELPFSLQGGAGPARLEINMVLPDAGTVTVGRLSLVRLDGAGAEGLGPERTVGLIGAVVGSTIGILGGLIGWLVSRRRARAFVLRSMTVLSGLGIVLIGAGILAALVGTSWSFVTLLVLPGVVMATAFGLGLPAARRAYADAELRRMRAMDAG